MATCKHDNQAPREAIEALPWSQSNGSGERHRCAICAYEAGRTAGREEMEGRIRELEKALDEHVPPDSFGGASGRNFGPSHP